MKGKFFIRENTANLVTLSRGIFPPLFIFSALIHAEIFFLFFIILQFLLDFLDGFTARMMDIESHLGSKLDTLMDTINMTLMNVIFIYLTWDKTNVIREKYLYLLLITISILLLRHILAFIFLKKPSTIHLWSGKISGGVLLFAIMVTLKWELYPWLFLLVCCSYIIYGIEGALIYIVERKKTDEKITSIFQLKSNPIKDF